MTNYPVIILKKGKGQSIHRFHPWIFSGAIQNKDDGIKNGQIVNVLSDKMDFFGTGFYQDGSIAVKLLQFTRGIVDRNFWKNKISNAFFLRKTIGITGQSQTNVYRLVNGEGDGLPGLIIDYYHGVLVIQPHQQGYYPFLEDIIEVLKEIYGPELIAIYLKDESHNPDKNPVKEGFLFGNAENVIVKENNISFLVDWKSGQKTGFFIDQRENRALLQKYCNGKNVLNAFCYTGAFSIYAMAGGAKHVDEIDSSAKALEISAKNKELNQIDTSQITSINQDAVRWLNDVTGKYDIIILDPPAFAKHLSSRNNAIRAYTRINELAIRQLNPGGIIFTFSCSQVVMRSMFESAIVSASINAGRNIRILNRLSQPADHPVSVFHPEGEYLKGLVIHVD